MAQAQTPTFGQPVLLDGRLFALYDFTIDVGFNLCRLKEINSRTPQAIRARGR
jgi:hypothetical protein